MPTAMQCWASLQLTDSSEGKEVWAVQDATLPANAGGPCRAGESTSKPTNSDPTRICAPGMRVHARAAAPNSVPTTISPTSSPVTRKPGNLLEYLYYRWGSIGCHQVLSAITRKPSHRGWLSHWLSRVQCTFGGGTTTRTITSFCSQFCSPPHRFKGVQRRSRERSHFG